MFLLVTLLAQLMKMTNKQMHSLFIYYPDTLDCFYNYINASVPWS